MHRLAGAGAPQQVAQGGGAFGAQPIGSVETAEGVVTAIRADGIRVTLDAGDTVYEGDIIFTSGDGAVAIGFVDDTAFTLGGDARMVLDQLVYDPATNEGTSAFSVVQGLFSFVSGAIAKTGAEAMTVRTPVATIGVRGTEVAVQAAAEGAENVITLLGGEGGITGEIVITNAAGTQVLNIPYQTITLSSFFDAPGVPQILPEAEVRQMFGGTIEMLRTQIRELERDPDRFEQRRPATEQAGEAEPGEAAQDAEAAIAAEAEQAAGEGVEAGAIEAAQDAASIAFQQALAQGTDPQAAAEQAFARALAGEIDLGDLVETAAGGVGPAAPAAGPDLGAAIPQGTDFRPGSAEPIEVPGVPPPPPGAAPPPPVPEASSPAAPGVVPVAPADRSLQQHRTNRPNRTLQQHRTNRPNRQHRWSRLRRRAGCTVR